MDDMDISDFVCLDAWDEDELQDKKLPVKTKNESSIAPKNKNTVKLPDKKKSSASQPVKRGVTAKKETPASIPESPTHRKKALSLTEKKPAVKKILVPKRKNALSYQKKIEATSNPNKVSSSNHQALRGTSPISDISDDELDASTRSRIPEREHNFYSKQKNTSEDLYLKRKRLIEDLKHDEESNNRYLAAQDKPKIQPCDSSSDFEAQKRKRTCSVNKENLDTSSVVPDLHEECSCNINLYSENLADLRISCINTNFDAKKKVFVKQIKISDLIVTRNQNEGTNPLFESGIFKTLSGCQCPIHSSKRIVTMVNSPCVSKEYSKSEMQSNLKSSFTNVNSYDTQIKNYVNSSHSKLSKHQNSNHPNRHHKKSSSRKYEKHEAIESKDRDSRRGEGHHRKSLKQEEVERQRSDRSSSIEIIDERITKFGNLGESHHQEKNFPQRESQDLRYHNSRRENEALNRVKNSPALEEGEIDDSGENEVIKRSQSFNYKTEDSRSYSKQMNDANKSGSGGQWCLGDSTPSTYRTKPSYNPRFNLPHSRFNSPRARFNSPRHQRFSVPHFSK